MSDWLRFDKPQFLYLALLVLPLLAGFLYWAWRVKQKLMTQFIQSRLLPNLTVGVSPQRQKFRLVLYVVATVLLFLAMARPQWGFDWQEAKQQGLDIIVAIDTSRSMLAEDVPPNRLTRAKLAALDLMKQAKNDRLGLVAFAGSAFLQTPLTLDEEAFRQSVEALDVGIIPQGGTALTEAIDTTLTAFETNNDNHKVLILFTDGEDHDEDAETLATAEKAAKAGLRIFTIGIGTKDGELLRVKDDQGNATFLKDDEGNAVKSHLNETLLEKVATAANGFYLPLRGATPMETLYQRGLAPLPKSDSTTKLTKVFRERFQWPLGFAILCLLVEMFLPETKRVARKATGSNARTNASGPALAPPVVSQTVAILLLLALPAVTWASPSSAKRQFEKGSFDAALQEYERLAEQKTNDYRLHYNAGTAAYRAKQFATAEKHLNAVLNSPEITSDLETQQRTYYNLGNTLFKLGEPMPEPDKKQETWEQALASYDRALKLKPTDTDAKNNLEFVKKQIEELKQQQQQQPKNDKNNKDNKDQKDQQQQDQKQQDKKDDKKDQKDQKNQQNQNQDQQGKKDDQQKKDDKGDKKDQKQQQEQQQQQAKKDKEKKEKEAQQKQAGDKDKKQDQQDEEMQAALAGRMTQQQAKQFLDAQRQDEKALIFSPENKPQKQVNRKVKDW